MKPDDKTPDLLDEVEGTTVLDDEGNDSTDVAIDEYRPGSFYQFYSKHLQSAKEKADKNKKARKAKKKKREKKKQTENEVEYLPPMIPCEDIGEHLLSGHEILSPSESLLRCRNQTVSGRIRSAQGRVINDRLQLRLDQDSGVFFGMASDYYAMSAT